MPASEATDHYMLIHLFSRPSVPVSRGGQKLTPASVEAGVGIGLVAGAGFEPATSGL